MAKVTITYEDTENGTVITSDPGISELLAMANHPDNMTQAQAYALEAWHGILRKIKDAAHQRRNDNTRH